MWDSAFTLIIDTVNLNYVSNPVTLSANSMLKYELLQPVEREQKPYPDFNGPFGG